MPGLSNPFPGLLTEISDWYDRNNIGTKLVGGGVRGAASRGLLGMDAPDDASRFERDVYENTARASAPALGAGKAAIVLGGMQRARKNLDAVEAGMKPKGVKIAELTDEQFAAVNAKRKEKDFPPLPSKEVHYVGQHHSASRSADGYAKSDILKQLMSGLDDSSVAKIDDRGRVNLVSQTPRFDGYRSTVEDTVALMPSGNKTYAEAYSVIPKGDSATRSFFQKELAGAALPGDQRGLDRFQRIEQNQPAPSLLTEQDVRNWIAQDNAVKMLGLPENNTAMDRARALGFDAETFHGTFNRFDNFDLSKASPRSQYMPGVFTADNPGMAENYGDFIMPLLQRRGTTVVDRVAAVRDGKPKPDVDTIYDKAAGIRVTNNPANIRSRFAAFDPARINENNLLASVAAGGVSIPLLMGFGEKEQD